MARGDAVEVEEAEEKPEEAVDELLLGRARERKAKKNDEKRRAKREMAPGWHLKDLASRELEAIVFGQDPLKQLDEERRAAKRARDDLPADKEVHGAAKRDARTARRKQEFDKRMEELGKEEAEGQSKQAWVDPDDAEMEVNVRSQRMSNSFSEKVISGTTYEKKLRENFVKLHGNKAWAEDRPKVEETDSEDDGEEFIASSAKTLAEGSGGALPPNQLDILRMKDVRVDHVTDKGKSQAAIQTLQFHPSSEVMLLAGRDKRLHLHAVDGEENPKLSSHFFEAFQIYEATFSPTGDHIFMVSKGRMQGLDVQTGDPFRIVLNTQGSHKNLKNLVVGPDPTETPGLKCSGLYSVIGEGGAVMLCDVTTKYVVRTLRMASEGVHAIFSTTRDTLITADVNNSIYEWDVGTGRCLQRGKEAWATHITSLAMSRPSSFSPRPLLAVGTSSGNVDLMDFSGPKMPKTPEKNIDNLVTSIDAVRFNPTGEVLASCTLESKGGLKMSHTNTFTVFENWPSQTTPITRVTALDFSKRGGFMGIGGQNGRVLIYRLQHYLNR